MCVLDNRMLRIGTYFLAPHNYVALCLASRFRRAKVLFYLLAGFQVAADFASCVALAMVMSAHGDALASAGSQHRTAIIQFADDGQMTGGFSVDFIDDSDPSPPIPAERWGMGVEWGSTGVELVRLGFIFHNPRKLNRTRDRVQRDGGWVRYVLWPSHSRIIDVGRMEWQSTHRAPNR